MFDETNPAAVPITWPTRTASPFLTQAAAGAPICCDNGTTAISGSGKSAIASVLLILYSGV